MARTAVRSPRQAYEAYVQNHQDLLRAYEANNRNQSQADWGRTHWLRHGVGENRLTPTSLRYTDQGRRGQNWLTDAELKQKGINDALSAVGNLFGGRQSYYNKYLDDVYGLSEGNIEDAYKDAKRQLGFSLLRKGLTTGKVDVDMTEKMEKTKAKSLASAMRYAQGLTNQLKSRDAQLQAKLRGAAASGALTSDAIGQYSSQLAKGSVVPWDTGQINWSIPQTIFGAISGVRRPWEDEGGNVGEGYSGVIT